ncbi:MAG: NusG domain II-containing protein [Clostridia bacterium]|nr:NusG domain II-containing protein [Clostridia bacterium]
MFRTKVSLWDWILIAVVLLAACSLLLFAWLPKSAGSVLLVTTPQGSAEYSLLEDREFSLSSNGVTLTVRIADGAALVTESDCPDGVCRASASIAKVGEMIVCAPAGIRLTVKGGESDVDFVAG